MVDVCLVLMPYAAVERPSIALGLLKSCLQKNDLQPVVLYPNLWFAEEIGLNIYQALSQQYLDLFWGEWTFSGTAFPGFNPNHDEYLRISEEVVHNDLNLRTIFLNSNFKSVLWQVRKQAEIFVDRLARSILDLSPSIVGCSSTFNQHCASLALLRRIREQAPEVITLIGGANCEAEMGLTTKKEFPWVDFVVSGEGDELLPILCKLLLKEGKQIDPSRLPYGVIGSESCRKGRKDTFAPPRASVQDMSKISIPDYDEYFQSLTNLSIAPYIKPGLLIETSRGCWWGQQHHCTFCGLNGSSMGYRSKSSERVSEELAQLSQKYRIRKFEVVDNILDMAYMETLLPQLAALQEPYSIFFETKANLTRNQIQQLADAGIRSIQPGIESMHNSILKLINKGTTAWINVQLLKWAREMNIQVHWLFLMGIPNESDVWYAEMAEWLPLIVHLQPPSAINPIQFQRFSVYHQRPDDFGLTLLPNQFYQYIYPVSLDALKNLAYFFEDITEYSNLNDPKCFYQPNAAIVRSQLQTWMRLWSNQYPNSPVLKMKEENRQIKILDTRPCSVKHEQIISDLAYWVYIFCEQAVSPQSLVKAMRKQGLAKSWEEIQPVVKELQECKVLLNLHGRLLSLAVREPKVSRHNIQGFPGGYVKIDSYLCSQAGVTIAAKTPPLA